jgi:hypothetical protein
MEAAVYKIGSSKPISFRSIKFQNRNGLISFDLRTLNLSKARVSVKLLKSDEFIDAAEVFLEARTPNKSLKNGQKIAVLLDIPEGIDEIESWPVTFGVYAYNYVNNIQSSYPTIYPTNIKWRNFWTDLIYSTIALYKRNLRFHEYRNSLEGEIIDAVRTNDDPRPFRAMTRMLPQLALSR